MPNRILRMTALTKNAKCLLIAPLVGDRSALPFPYGFPAFRIPAFRHSGAFRHLGPGFPNGLGGSVGDKYC